MMKTKNIKLYTYNLYDSPFTAAGGIRLKGYKVSIIYWPAISFAQSHCYIFNLNKAKITEEDINRWPQVSYLSELLRHSRILLTSHFEMYH